MRKIKFLRAIVLALLAGFIVLVGVRYTSNSQRRQSKQDPVQSTIRKSEKPQSVADEFLDTQTVAGRVVSRIRARRTMGFKSGWYTLEDVQLTILRADGKTYELFCPQAQFKADTKEAEVKGGVRVTSNDGLEIVTEELRFDGNQLANSIPVHFKVDRWEGETGGIELNVQQEVLQLLSNVKAHTAGAKPGDPPMSLTAGAGTITRKLNDISFHLGVVFHRSVDALHCDSLTARTDATHKKLTLLNGDGNVLMHLARGSTVGGGKPLDDEATITSDGFFGNFDAEGAIHDFLLVSRTVAHAALSGPPHRQIDSRQFQVLFNGGNPAELHADGSVVMTETGEINRTITADSGKLYFDPATRRAANGLLEGSVHYSDPRSEATAEKASFELATNHVFLTALPGSQPTITSDGEVIKGNLIDIDARGKILKASAAVVAHLTPKKGSVTPSSTSIFPGGSSPVFVNSDSLIIRQETASALFSGNVRAWQETNTLLTAELQIDSAGDLITARGGVRSVLYNTRDKAKKSIPIFGSSDTLTARRKDQKVELDGHVRIDDETKTVTADQASLLFGVDRKLERIDAANHISVVEKAASRKGTGDKALYLARTQMLYLDGAPAVLTEPRGTVKGPQIVFDLGKNKVDVSGGGPTETTYNPQ